MIRIGHGFDVHKFAGQGPIIIEGRSDNLKVTREEYSLSCIYHHYHQQQANNKG